MRHRDSFNVGNSLPAFCQSVHPSRHTSESLLTRPSDSHLRMTSPRAGPYWPPVGGRTYQIAAGASAIGSLWPTAAAIGRSGRNGGAAGAGPSPPRPLAPAPLLLNHRVGTVGIFFFAVEQLRLAGFGNAKLGPAFRANALLAGQKRLHV